MKKIMRCLAILIISGLITGCTNKEQRARERILGLTNIEIPDNSTLVYHLKDNSFMHGRLPQYSVFSFEETPTQFLIDSQFKNDNDFKERYILQFYFFERAYEPKIPQEYLVSWENENLYLEVDYVYFIFFVESNLLSVYVEGN